MKTIHRQILDSSKHEYSLPYDAHFLGTFFRQSGEICVTYQSSYRLDPAITLITYQIFTFHTGETVPEGLWHLGTVHLTCNDLFEKHIFCRTPPFESPTPSIEPVINQEK